MTLRFNDRTRFCQITLIRRFNIILYQPPWDMCHVYLFKVNYKCWCTRKSQKNSARMFRPRDRNWKPLTHLILWILVPEYIICVYIRFWPRASPHYKGFGIPASSGGERARKLHNINSLSSGEIKRWICLEIYRFRMRTLYRNTTVHSKVNLTALMRFRATFSKLHIIPFN
jgi:hypothetical protein